MPPADDDTAAGEDATASVEVGAEPEEREEGVRAVDEASAAATEQELTQDDQSLVQQLVARDAEVRAHEQAHIAAGGQYVTGGASFTYQLGPDGKRYAIGGEVGIDTSMKTGDPAANLEKARQIQRAALAPAEPSAQDRSVAASAQAMEIEAQRQLSELQQTKQEADLAATAESAGGGRSGEHETPAADDRTGSGTEEPEVTRGAQASLEQRIQDFFADATASRLVHIA